MAVSNDARRDSVMVVTLKKPEWSFDPETGRGRFPASKLSSKPRRGQAIRVKTYGAEPVDVTVSMVKNGEVLVRAARGGSQDATDPDLLLLNGLEEAGSESADSTDSAIDPESHGDSRLPDDSAAGRFDADDYVEATAPGATASKPPSVVHSSPVSAVKRELSAAAGDKDSLPADAGKFETLAYDAAKHTRLFLSKVLEDSKTLAVRLAANVRKNAHEAKYAMQRSKRGWSERDMWNLDYVLLKYMSGMLAELSATGHGYPGDYEESRDKWLVKHDGEDYEKWLHSAARTAARVTRDLDERYGEEISLDEAFNETVEEYGVGASAWMQDLDHASQVLDQYAESVSDVFNHWSKDVDLYGRAEADRRSQMLEAEFKKTWAWIGEWLPAMWD